MYNFISIKESRWPQALSKLYIVYKHSCDRVAMLQLEISKLLTGDLVS